MCSPFLSFLKNAKLLTRVLDQVYGITVRHFFKGANILNPYYPEKELLIIPMNGISAISPGGQLPHDTYCYIKDKQKPTLYGDEIDVIIVAFDKGPET